MAVKLVANYAKKIGLPGYSSHQFSVSVETELHGVEDVPGESERLYEQLQEAVDSQIQKTGFVPPHEYGMDGNGHHRNGTNGHRSNGHGTNGHHQNGSSSQNGDEPGSAVRSSKTFSPD